MTRPILCAVRRGGIWHVTTPSGLRGSGDSFRAALRAALLTNH